MTKPLMELKTNGLTKSVDLFVLSRNATRFKQSHLSFKLQLTNGESLDVWEYRKDSTIITAWTKLDQLAVQIAFVEKSLLGSPVYTVLYADVDRRFQGNKLAATVYKHLVTQRDITICASDSQSKGAQKMWNYLSSDPSISPYAYDADSKKPYSLSPSPNGLIVKDTQESLYDTDYWAILTKKGGSLDVAMSSKLRNVQ